MWGPEDVGRQHLICAGVKKLSGIVVSIVAVLAAAALVLVLVRPAIFGRGERTIDSTSIGGEFNDIAQLATEEYVYSSVGKFDDEGLRLLNVRVPFTGKNFLVSYEGKVTAATLSTGQSSKYRARSMPATIRARCRSATAGNPRRTPQTPSSKPQLRPILGHTRERLLGVYAVCAARCQAGTARRGRIRAAFGDANNYCELSTFTS